MCNFRKKSQLFRYFVQQIVCSILPEDNTKDTNEIEVPEQCSNTYLMKCLYFACLESCANNNGIGLFNIFDNMKAYPRGPLEYDIYENLPNIEGLTYVDGRISKVKKYIENFEEDVSGYQDEISLAVKKLKEHGILQTNVSELIKLSHKLDSWNYAYNFCDDKKIVITQSSVQNELNQYLSNIRQAA